MEGFWSAVASGDGPAVASVATLVALVSAFTVVAITGPFAAQAHRYGLVDRPDARKQHRDSTPLVGGLTLVLVSVLLLVVPPVFQGAAWVVLLGIFVAGLGLVDDLSDLSARLRFGLQLLACAALATLPGWRVEVLGDVLGTGVIAFGIVGAVLFTALCIVGVMNAVNMVDGIDGLTGSLCAMTLLVLAVFSAQAERVPQLLLCVALLGGTLGFVVCNLGLAGPGRKIFLGDAGSMFLGFTLGAVFVSLSQGPDAAFRPVAAGWLLGLPIMDTVAVMVARVLRKTSPFTPGRDHTHHLLLRAGLSDRETLVVVATVHLAMIGVGLWGEAVGAPAAALFWGFVALTVAHFGFRRAMTKALDDPLVRWPRRGAAALQAARARAAGSLQLGRERRRG